MSKEIPNNRSEQDQSLNILLIATRDVRGQMTGRKSVLNTTVDCLLRLGHRVVVAFFDAGMHGSDGDATDTDDQVRYYRIHGPRPLELITQLGSGFLFGKKPLNECLYSSDRALTALRDIAHSEKIDVVITDMVRTAAYGESLKLPWISDLDDLLSLRYSLIAKERKNLDGLLGYHKAPALRALNRLARPVIKSVLRKESAIIARREKDIAQRANLTLTVSSAEAEILSSRSSRMISTTPLLVRGPSQIAPLAERPHDLVFLGGLAYQPNRDAVYKYDTEISRQLSSYGLEELPLHVIGGGEGSVNYKFSPVIRFVGYVEDLDSELQKYKAMLIPELVQGGIKTKAVHAALNGVMILAHDSAIAGMRLQPNVDVLTWRSPAELAALLGLVRDNDPGLARIAENARHWAIANFGEQRADAQWREYLASVTAGSETASSQPFPVIGVEASSQRRPSQFAGSLSRIVP
ncbi:glycosyltransferase [Microvirga calopogonii]|uniref:glycosyltransferase n=1 Tax=Microvirga calopogonii TaxID=2078013 RepID=UPI000E0CFAD8|nr:glycosyltransferase [Microvirga calopogonii]